MLLKLIGALEPIAAFSFLFVIFGTLVLLDEGLGLYLVGYLGVGSVVGFFGLLYYRVKYKLHAERDMEKMIFVFMVAFLYWPLYSVGSLTFGLNNCLTDWFKPDLTVRWRGPYPIKHGTDKLVIEDQNMYPGSNSNAVFIKGGSDKLVIEDQNMCGEAKADELETIIARLNEIQEEENMK